MWKSIIVGTTALAITGASLVHAQQFDRRGEGQRWQPTAEDLRALGDTDREIETTFATLVHQRVGALVIGGDVFFNNRTEQLAALSVRHAMPTIFQYRRFTAAGGLMSYGPSFTDSYRLAGVYIGRILKGEKPADLPVQQLTKIELLLACNTCGCNPSARAAA